MAEELEEGHVKYEPAAPTLFGLCMRYFALRRKADISCLPRKIVERIENLRTEVDIILKRHMVHTAFPVSLFSVQENGDLDWPRTCERYFREFQSDELSAFVFATINGLCTRALYRRLTTTQRYRLLSTKNTLLKNTVRIMMIRGSSALPYCQFESILSAVENDCPGAARAWIGLKDELLNNVSYAEVLYNDEEPDFPDHPLDPAELGQQELLTGCAVMWSIRYGKYDMLRYLPVTDVTTSFYRIFPDGRVPLLFFLKMARPPATECRLNVNLINQLEYVARALLDWMPVLDIERVKREAVGTGHMDILNFFVQLYIGKDMIAFNGEKF